MNEKKGRVGIVAIGRNEGERLRRCLESALRDSDRVVYVDSGSTDDSCALARSLGVALVELDMSIPFTAARARNEGFHRLLTQFPDLNYVQFVDGDCELVAGWLVQADEFLDEHGEVAVVCGRRRERYPERSVYNMLCDLEWDTPIGEAKACGGDSMVRVEAFRAVGGFRDDLIAGEEPELCVRLRQAGWKIWRLDAEMTLHDADITRFSQWWRRAVRSGFAYAEGLSLHGTTPERFRIRESGRIILWGAAIPAFTLAAVMIWGQWGWAVLMAYPLQVGRLALTSDLPSPQRWWFGLFMTLGKFPELVGHLRFYVINRFTTSRSLIEYK